MTHDIAPVPSAPRPQKRLGQRFLVDQNIIRKIIELADLRPTETVLEIGPGRGALTCALCTVAQKVIAVEIDPKLVEYLAQTLSDCSNLEIRAGDALEFPYHALPKGTVIVANLPYYISTPLLFKLYEAQDRIDRMILMLQHEVARRLVAKPRTNDYGILSVLTQYRTEPSLAFRVSASCFRPRPEVDSAVVRLVMRQQRPIHVEDERLFIRIVRAAFAHRRKTVVNSLRDEGFPPDHIAHALQKAGVTSSRRAETLTLEEFAALANAMSMGKPSAVSRAPKAEGN